VDPIAVFEGKRKALISESNDLLAKAAEAGSADEYRARLDAIDAELPTVEKDLARARASAERTRNEPAARTFAAFVTGPEGQAILARHGFDPPPEMTR